MDFISAADMVFNEYAASVEKYGNWSDYTPDQMMGVIIHELMIEAGEAEALGDIHGEHGMIRELSQVAACCIKAIMVLANMTLAETSQPAGLNSLGEGCQPPASPSLHHLEDSSANHPEEVAR